MPKRGRKTTYARCLREAARIVNEHAWVDRWDPYRDTVNTLDPGEIAYLVIERLGHYDPRAVHVARRYTRSEVLSDPYGRGSLQFNEVPEP